MTETICENKESGIVLKNRTILQLTGIEDVISFDEMSIYLVTAGGNLLIEGHELHITILDVAGGNMTVEGEIGAMTYQDREHGKKGGFFSKIIK